MALNIKDPETEALVAELARRLDMTKTAVVRQTLKTRLAALAAQDEAAQMERAVSLRQFMETEIWPITRGQPPVIKEEWDDLWDSDDED